MRIFVCQNTPSKFFAEYPISQAANNFCGNLIATGAFDRVISMIPVNVTEPILPQCGDMPMECIQKRVFPHRGIGKWLNALLENISLCRKIRRKDTVWFYNISTYNFPAFFVLRILLRRNVFVLLADFTAPRNWHDSRHFVQYSLKRATGLLALSGRIKLPHPHIRAIAGIVPEAKINRDPALSTERAFFFSGTLGKVTGIDMAIQCFRELPEVELYVSGSGAPEYIRQLETSSPNIHYCGKLPFEEYLKLLNRFQWALNLRNPNLPENENNFPSKFLEYLAVGKTVLSTMRYPELDGFQYHYAEFDKESIKAEIRRMIQRSPEENQETRQRNQTMLQRFDFTSWLSAIENLERESLTI